MRIGRMPQRLGRRRRIDDRVDGPYVDERRLLIDAKDFHAVDLAAPIGFARQFDWYRASRSPSTFLQQRLDNSSIR